MFSAEPYRDLLPPKPEGTRRGQNFWNPERVAVEIVA